MNLHIDNRQIGCQNENEMKLSSLLFSLNSIKKEEAILDPTNTVFFDCSLKDFEALYDSQSGILLDKINTIDGR